MRPCSCVSTPDVAAAAAMPSTKMPVARSIATSQTVRYERLEYSERTVNTCGRGAGFYPSSSDAETASSGVDSADLAATREAIVSGSADVVEVFRDDISAHCR